jgi:hypothetical protein
MSLRSFVDSGGNEWQVFDVVPRADERRYAERREIGRSAHRAAGNATVPAGVISDDRRDGERRMTVGELARLSTIAGGWLCFERGADRRRLTPIPGDWRRCTESCLEGYCRQALTTRTTNKSAAIIPRR